MNSPNAQPENPNEASIPAKRASMDQQALISRFQSVYQQLNTHNAQTELLNSIYTQDIEFIDPLHRLQGLAALKSYCQNLYANLKSAHFKFHNVNYNENNGFIQWTLTFEHKRLNQGKPIIVEGTSHLEFQGNKIVRHQDYFDAGALLYEHIPVLGYGIQKIKHRIRSLS
jgi:hypothetical protein